MQGLRWSAAVSALFSLSLTNTLLNMMQQHCSSGQQQRPTAQKNWQHNKTHWHCFKKEA